MTKAPEKSSSATPDVPSPRAHDANNWGNNEGLTLPSQVASSGALDRLAKTAQDDAQAAVSKNTLLAYAKDWAHFARWCRMQGADPLPPSPQLISLYIEDQAAPSGKFPALSIASIERRLSGLSWGYAQRGQRLHRPDHHITAVLAGIRRRLTRPLVQKEAIQPQDIRDMINTLSQDLRGLRDRAILLIGFAGGLRRSEIVALDHSKDNTPDQKGWIEIFDDGVLITLRNKTGWREVEIGRGASDQTCPVHALSRWLSYGRIDFGPLFVAVSRDGLKATKDRLSDKHVARLIKQTVENAGLRPELPKAERQLLYSGHSLRAGLANSANSDKRYVQKQLDQGSSDITRQDQSQKERFKVNLTKAAGL